MAVKGTCKIILPHLHMARRQQFCSKTLNNHKLKAWAPHEGGQEFFSLETAQNCMLNKSPIFLHYVPHGIPEQITDRNGKTRNTFLVPVTAQILHMPKTSPNLTFTHNNRAPKLSPGFCLSLSLHGSPLPGTHSSPRMAQGLLILTEPTPHQKLSILHRI